MKRLVLLFICAFIIASCNRPVEENLSQKAREEIIQTEKDFSAMSESRGMKEAFLNYAADDVVKLRNREYPIVGINSLRSAFEADNDTASVLKWYPLKADAASSGELGYSYGNWEYTGKDSIGKEIKAFGNYFTVWKKNKNGEWKFTLDGGNTTPPPVNNEEKL
jgi:ketosteroid isomerase-like protein